VIFYYSYYFSRREKDLEACGFLWCCSCLCRRNYLGLYQWWLYDEELSFPKAKEELKQAK